MATLFSFSVIAVLILINGLFVAAEFAIIGVRPTRIEQLADGGNRAAGWVHGVLHDRRRVDRYIATAQLGITLASLGLGMYAEPAIAHLIEPPLHDWFGLEGTVVHTISFVIALALITYLHVVVGEMVPKSLALQRTETMALALATPMRLAGKLFSIPVTLLNRIGLWTLKLLSIPPPGEGSRIYSPDELEMIVSESYAGGLIEAYEQALVTNLFDFAEERVEQVMVPRPMMTAVPDTVDEKELLSVFDSVSYNRLPVYHNHVDDIVGVVHLKDLVRQQIADRPFDVHALLRPVSFVPESLPVKALLAQFQRQRQQIAIVIDEHGGTLGLVTVEDILEEVVGEVRDEFDKEAEPLSLVAPGHLVAQGTVQIEDIERYASLGAHGYDVQTVGGLVWARLDRRPEVGDQVQVGDVTLRVDDMSGLSVTQVSVLFSPAKI
ncbi:MAG: HlyC/CorC family transporter [Anaerolineae bacterium]|nr:HlyC/CorC family transporter [Anaerolineae bacterium]